MTQPIADGLAAAERASRDEIEALQRTRLAWTLRHAYGHVPHYHHAFDAAGVHPSDFHELSDLAKFPFTVKQDLRDNYPFGLFAVPRDQVARIHGSSGTTGKPIVVGYTRRDIEMWADVMARSIRAAGGRPGKAPEYEYQNYDTIVWDLPAVRASNIADMESHSGIGTASGAAGPLNLAVAQFEVQMHDPEGAALRLKTTRVDDKAAVDVAASSFAGAILAEETGDLKAAAAQCLQALAARRTRERLRGNLLRVIDTNDAQFAAPEDHSTLRKHQHNEPVE